MKLLDLKSDFVFRTVFTRSLNSLIDLLNDILDFPQNQKIKELKILTPEIAQEHTRDKAPILDIKAVSSSKELFNIEMQVFPQRFYAARVLYYWARLYSSQLQRGGRYDKLVKTYSINILDFTLIEESSRYRHRFSIIEKNNLGILLTEKLDMAFLELPKFTKSLWEADDGLELWLYLIKNSHYLAEADMKILVEKKPVMKEALEELEKISLDPAIFSAEEYRRKALSDYNSLMADSYHEGMAKGIAEGEAKGKAEGITEGEAKGKAEIAKKLLMEGYKVSEVSKLTGFSEEELRELV